MTGVSFYFIVLFALALVVFTVCMFARHSLGKMDKKSEENKASKEIIDRFEREEVFKSLDDMVDFYRGERK